MCKKGLVRKSVGWMSTAEIFRFKIGRLTEKIEDIGLRSVCYSKLIKHYRLAVTKVVREVY